METVSPGIDSQAIKRLITEGTERIERLTFECRIRLQGNPLDVDRINQAVFRAAAQFGVSDKELPRGYRIIRNGNTKAGYQIKHANGRIADPAQLALDYASGWLSEFAA